MQTGRTNLKARISFHSSEWQAMRDWLKEERELAVSMLIGAKTQDDSQKYRGKIELVDKILHMEKDAAK